MTKHYFFEKKILNDRVFVSGTTVSVILRVCVCLFVYAKHFEPGFVNIALYKNSPLFNKFEK